MRLYVTLLFALLKSAHAAVTQAETVCEFAAQQGAAIVGNDRFRETSYRCHEPGELVIVALPGHLPEMHVQQGSTRLQFFPLATWIATQNSLLDIEACAPYLVDRGYFGAPRSALVHVLTRADAKLRIVVDGETLPSSQRSTTRLDRAGLHAVEWWLEEGCLRSLASSDDGFRAHRQLAAWWQPVSSRAEDPSTTIAVRTILLQTIRGVSR